MVLEKGLMSWITDVFVILIGGDWPESAPLNGPCGAVTVALLAASLTACTDGSAAVVKPAMYVRTEIVQPRVRQGSVTLTGELQARFSADLSFRVSGRVRERLVEIGTQVAPGTVLARLDATEQQADLDAATSAVTAAEAQLRVAKATFDRQNTSHCTRLHDARGVRSGAGRIANCRGLARKGEGAAGHGKRCPWVYRAARECIGNHHSAQS